MSQGHTRAYLPQALVRAALAWPWLTITVWTAAVVASLAGMTSLKIETTVDSVLDRSGSEWRFYQESQREFGGDEVIVLMVSAPRPFDIALLRRVLLLSDRLGSIRGVRRVDSVATVPSVSAGRDGVLVLQPPVTESRLEEPDAEATVKELVEADPDTRGLLVSADGRSFALNVLLEQDAYQRSDQILEELSLVAGPGTRWSGVPVFRAETNRRTESELLRFVPMTTGVILGLLLLLFRSLLLALLPVLTSLVSVVVVLGVMGALGMPMTISTLILPTVILALGCAYSMHVLCAALAPDGCVSGPGLGKRLAAVALPVALSGLTTAIGFVALSTVRIDALRQVGGLGGVGALVATFAVLTLLPALLSFLPIQSESTAQRWLRLHGSQGVVRLVARYHLAIVVVSALLCCIAIAGLSGLRVESDVIKWFPRDDPLRRAYGEIRDELSGISPVNVVVESRSGRSIAEPEVIESLLGLSRHLESLPSVSRASSIATPIERAHSILVQGGDAHDLNSATIEQYLLVLSGSDHLQDLISLGRNKANVWVRSRSNGSEDLLSVAEEAEGWWSENGPRWTLARSTGIMFEFARAQQAIAWGQVSGLGVAFLAISVVLYLAFGSLGIAMVALLPNVVPVLFSFGLLAWLGVPLDAGTVLVGNLALGIAVDDTIHLVDSMRRDSRDGFVQDFSECLKGVLPPICLTTLILAAGFAVLGFSSFVFIRNLGLLTALILVVCLVADLLLLPSVLLLRRVVDPRVDLKAAP
jgi:predicted RND superfamily exporter protein